MKILVTGGAGFIGSHLVDAYLARGDEVVVVDDLSSGSRENLPEEHPRLKFIQMPIQLKELRKIFERERPDIVNHHAAQKSVRDSVADPLKDADINIMGLLSVLESMRAVGCKKIIFASSGGVVYGEQEKFPADENHSKNPSSPYGVSKLSSEYYLSFYAMEHGFDCVALRYANVYGPRQDPFGEAGVVAIFCQNLLMNKECLIYGSGEQTRDFVYVGDIVSANLAAEKCLGGGLRPLNVGTGKEVSVNTLFGEICKVVGTKAVATYKPKKPGEQLRSVLDTSLITKLTGWRVNTGLSDGLKATAEWIGTILNSNPVAIFARRH